MMKKTLVAVAVAGALSVPAAANAADVLGKNLQIYGKVHLSLDSVDNGADKNLSLASNSSRLGFKGQYDVSDSLQGIWQIESKVVYDNGGKSAFVGRNTFAGLKGGFGTIAAGYKDTPFKDIRGKFDIFGDTVGDARNLVGTSSSTSTSLDIRAKNMIEYSSPTVGGLQFNGMYSTAWDAQSVAGQDNNDYSAMSLNLLYHTGDLGFYVGWQKAKTGPAGDDVKGTRVAATYDVGAARIGAMYEKTDGGNNDAGRINRSAYGVNVAFEMDSDNKIKLQYVKAGESDLAGGNDGGKQYSVGWDHKLGKATSMYVMYNSLKNDPNAVFRIKGGHDTDVYTPAAAGDTVKAFSVGFIQKF
ncbi:MAG TPA: porin [Gammaproteobacteria bacterium]|nr:porin [Gammaproteobacteria bacterium]